MTQVAQEGGNHYAAEYQHWDWAEDSGMGSLEYAATKYIARWRKKDGLKDLKKARSYVLKLIVRADEFGRKNKAIFNGDQHAAFIVANQLNALDATICSLLLLWQNTECLKAVMSLITHLIGEHYPETLEAHTSGASIPEWEPPVIEQEWPQSLLTREDLVESYK